MKALSSILVLCASSALVLAQTNAAISKPKQGHVSREVSVFFGNELVLSPDELVSAAISALSKSGFTVKNQSHCAINVVVGGAQPGCVVILEDHKQAWYYSVRFDVHGKPFRVRGAPVDTGGLPAGQPPPEFPTGGVRVSPK